MVVLLLLLSQEQPWDEMMLGIYAFGGQCVVGCSRMLPCPIQLLIVQRRGWDASSLTAETGLWDPLSIAGTLFPTGCRSQTHS